jgi:hypothetical protein
MTDEFPEHSYTVVNMWISDIEDIIPHHYFKMTYGPLHGRDWIRFISAEDRQALCRYAFQCSNYGRNGGMARAAKATRDNRGRFAKNPAN